MRSAGGHLYAAYGLRIESSLPLPLAAAGECDGDGAAAVRHLKPDVRIFFARRDAERDDIQAHGCYRAAPREARLHYEDVAQIHVRAGHEIELYPFPDPPAELLTQFVIGVAMGILLHQRGHFTLHASAVELADGAVALCGWKGMGKSTSAAALHAAGHPLITDDTVVCDTADVGLVLPGVRQLKLDPEAAAKALGVDPESLPRVVQNYERRLHRLDDAYRARPLPLRCIYVLAWGEAVGVEELAPAKAFVELARHSYALRFLGNRGGAARHFEQLSELARNVPVRRLFRPPTIEAIPEVIRAVEHSGGALPLEA